MKRTAKGITLSAALLLAAAGSAAAQGAKPLKKCPADAVVSGTLCMDKYEAGVWRVPDATGANGSLVKLIQQGKATLAHLTSGGAIQLGIAGDDYAPCDDGGQSCANDVYAVSLPGVTPSSRVTWFQAQQACKNARKRLPSNAEWQSGAGGSPDPGGDLPSLIVCKVAGALEAAPTGWHTGCVSFVGAFDMVGNLAEWTADWVPRSTGCGAWSIGVSPTGDQQCLAGAATTGEPGALVRGGTFGHGAVAGPLAIAGSTPLSHASAAIGFRCAR